MHTACILYSHSDTVNLTVTISYLVNRQNKKQCLLKTKTNKKQIINQPVQIISFKNIKNASSHIHQVHTYKSHHTLKLQWLLYKLHALNS